jgi:DNA replication protein DnaC
MPTNPIYDIIEHEYEQLRDNEEHILAAKRAKLFAVEPRLKEIENELGSAGIKLSRIFLTSTNREESLQKYQAQCVALENERTALLEKHGLPKDYLRLRYHCNRCKDTGYTDGKRCQCFSKRLINHYYDMSNIRKQLETENFSTFNFDRFSTEGNPSPRTKMENIYNECVRKIADFENTPMNMFFYGRTGLGKTFMCNCVAKALLDASRNVIYMTAYDLLETLTKAHFNAEDSTLADKVSLIRSCEMLIIDDLGTETMTTLTNTELFNIINSRLLEERSTIISTNRTIPELMEAYSERIVSRLLGKYTVCEFIGNDLRL